MRSLREVASPHRRARLHQHRADALVPEVRERSRRAVAEHGALDQAHGGVEVRECRGGTARPEEPQTRIRVQHGSGVEVVPRPWRRRVPGVQGVLDKGPDLCFRERPRAREGRRVLVAIIADELPVRRGGLTGRRQLRSGPDGHHDGAAQQRA